MKKVIIIVLSMICSLTALAQQKKVAVYVTGEIDGNYKKVIGSTLVDGITRCIDYTAVERTSDFLSSLAKEQKYQRSGVVSDEQIAQLGKQYGVQYVVVADVSEVFETFFVSARLVDVETAEIIKSTTQTEKVDDMSKLINLSENVVSSLLGITFFNEGDVIILGPFKTFRDVYKIITDVPKGYYIASSEDIERIKLTYSKKMNTPIWTSPSIETRYEKGVKIYDITLRGPSKVVNGKIYVPCTSFMVSENALDDIIGESGFIYLIRKGK